jgi:hypothetical protein
MRDLVYYVAVSLDGYIAAPDGSFDAFPVEGDLMPVLLSEFADAVPAHVLSAIGMDAPLDRFGTVIQGWNSAAVSDPASSSRSTDGAATDQNPWATVRRLR